VEYGPRFVASCATLPSYAKSLGERSPDLLEMVRKNGIFSQGFNMLQPKEPTFLTKLYLFFGPIDPTKQ
jgi:hypothetical protein